MRARILSIIVSVAMVFSTLPAANVSAASGGQSLGEVVESGENVIEDAKDTEPESSESSGETLREEASSEADIEESDTAEDNSAAESSTATESSTAAETDTNDEKPEEGGTTVTDEIMTEETATETVMAVLSSDIVKPAAVEDLKEDTNYVLVSKASQMAMTVSGYATGNNATIMQMPVGNYTSQVWSLDFDDEGYCKIINDYSSKIINVPGASKDAGVTVIQFNNDNGNNAKWMITDAGEGYYRITPKLVDTFGLGVKNASANRGTEIVQETYTGADSQLWQLVEVAEVQENPKPEDPQPKEAIDRYLDKFYYVEDGYGYLKNQPENAFWTDAEIFEIFIDAYERLGDAKYLTLAEQFYNGIIKRRSESWSWNGYNDDVMWMVIGTARLYLLTGEEEYLTVAKANFDMCYERAWSEDLGGGLWWTTGKGEKNACVNGPGAIAACLLGEATQDASYYTKAEEIIDWEYNTLFDKGTGAVWDNVKKDGTTFNYWASTYNQGTFIGATTMLYKHTSNSEYYNMAKLAADYSAKMGDGNEGYLNREQNNPDLIGFKGILARWFGYFTRECNVSDYDDWMMANATAAWNNRNSDDLMWTEFGRVTIEDIENSEEIINKSDNGEVNTKSEFAAWGCSPAVSWLLNCTNMQPAEETEERNWELKSPDQNTVVSVKLNTQGALSYSVKQGEVVVIESSPLGMVTSLGDFTKNLKYKTEKINTYDETYTVLSGKKSEYVNNGRESELVFETEKKGVEFSVIFRAYDDGIAFRYAIGTAEAQDMTIDPNNEFTGITVPAQTKIWYMPRVNNNFMYEDEYLESTIENLPVGTKPSMPMLYQTGEKYVLVTEADKHGNYVGSLLEVEENRMLRTKFDIVQTNAVETQSPFTSPWRAFIIGDEETIVNNTMVENLSPAPSEEYDFEEWVEPGVSSWSWVSYYGGQEDPEIHKKFIDLASEMGWKYYILDEKWQPAGTDGSSYEGMWEWFDEVKQHADEKGVKLIAWVNKSDVDTAQEREARFKEWSEAGIVGIKVDFFFNETQNVLKLHDEIYADAAKYKLLVNVHGSNPPSGEIRTYPNVIAREAIRGQEQGGIKAEQYTLIPFIRAAVGTSDVTEQLYSRDPEKTSMGFQIALSTLVENGIRSMGSKPEEYYAVPEAVSYYMNFPATWDDTKLISAKVGEYVNIARKSGDTWYAAGISVEERDVTWKPEFLDSDKTYTAILYTEKDGERQALNKTVLKNVTKDTELNLSMQNGGGYALKLIPQGEDGLQALTLTPANIRIQAQYTKEVKLGFIPADTKLTDVTWEVKDPAIAAATATGSGVTIKGLKAGTTQVTATSVYDESVKATLQVEVTSAAYTLNTDKWTVFNDNANYLITGTNKVEIQAETGVINNNVFAMKIPEGDTNFEIEVKMSGNLSENYQGGFVGLFNPNSLLNNYVSAGRRYHTTFDTGGTDKNNHFALMSGQNTEAYVADAQKAQAAYVRLVKEGSAFTGYYRFNETDAWTQIEEPLTIEKFADPSDLYVGFYASCGGSNNGITVTFEDFKYNGSVVNLATLGAGVQPESYTVEFDSKGGTLVESQIVYENQKAVKPDDPKKTNYKFAGWQVNGQTYDFDTPVTKNLKLIAKWDIDVPLYEVSLEAEDATRSGGANIVEGNGAAECSGGAYVGNLGGDKDGTVTYSVEGEVEGRRTVKIHYCTYNTRDFEIEVNGKVVTTISCPGTGGWGKPCETPIEMEIELKAGTNVIAISGVDKAAAPNLDKIEIELTGEEAKAFGFTVPDEPGEEESSEEESSSTEEPSSTEETSTTEEPGSTEETSTTEEPGTPEEPGIPADDPGDVLPEDLPEGGPQAVPEGLWIAGIDEDGYDYTGKAIKPVVRVYDYKTLLTEKKDYTLSYKNNTKAYTLEEDNARYSEKKVPTITVKGKGNYSGKETVTFKILPLDINGESFDLDDIAVAYKTNKTQKVVPILLWNGKKLKYKMDFEVTYPDEQEGTYVNTGAYKNTGVYTIRVKGINNFAGTRDVTLEITGTNPISKVSVKGLTTQYYNNGKEITPGFTVWNGKEPLALNEDYTFTYEDNEEVGTAYLVLTGIGNYSGQKRVSFKIKGWSIKNAKVNPELPKSVDYNGKAHEPECSLQIKIDGKDRILVKDTDYTVSYAKNTNAGTATITFTGMGGFSGTLKKTFKINKFKLDEDTANLFTVEEGITAAFAKGGSKPKPVVKFNGVTLTEGTDYTLSYKNNKAVNDGSNPDKEPTIIVKGKGSFTGSESVSFKIVSQDIENLKMIVADKVESSKKNGWKSTVKVVDLDEKTLKAGTDYDKNQIEYTYKADTTLANGEVRAAGAPVQNNDIVPVGTVIVVKVYGINNYAGDLTGEYRILKKGTDIKSAKVVINPQIYTGKEITLTEKDIKVTLGGKDLEYGTEFMIDGDSYKNRVKKGNATVTIIGISDGTGDEYGGTKTVKFTIRAKEMKWWETLAEALFG